MGDFSSFRKQGARGNGPPSESDVPRSELYRKIADRSPPFVLLPFPRLDDDGQPIGEFRLQVLRQSEIDDAAVEAERYVRKRMNERGSDGDENVKPNQEAWREIFQDAMAVELVYRSTRDATDASKPLFSSPADIRHELTRSEIVHIVNAYDQLQTRFGPSFRLLTEDEVEEWITALMRGAEIDLGPLGCLAPGQLVMLIGSLASLCRSYQTDISSAGSPSSDSASATATTNPQPDNA